MKKENMAAKKKVGFFSFTCCEGCTINFIEVFNKKFDAYMKKIKIVNMRQLKTDKKINSMDIAFVEGAISTQSELRKLKEIREKSKFLVALGSGACNGFPSNQRNKFDEKKKKQIQELLEKMHQNNTIEPLKTYVKVDDEINGCPAEEKLIIEKMEGYLK
jgi:coenzyme F420-reducing hydrogenase gamma subunit